MFGFVADFFVPLQHETGGSPTRLHSHGQSLLVRILTFDANIIMGLFGESFESIKNVRNNKEVE